MNASRISGPYDEIICNLMEDLGVNAQIDENKSYYIQKGKLTTESESWYNYIMKNLGYSQSPNFSWGTSIKRTLKSMSTGETIRNSILDYIESHAKSVLETSKKIGDFHKKLSKDSDIHHVNLLKNFTKSIEDSIIGLGNLQKIYLRKGDERFVAKMTIIIQSLVDQIDENKKIMTLYPIGK